MPLLDRIRKHVRVTARLVPDSEGRLPDEQGYVQTFGSPFDEELEMLIGAAKRDLVRVGIRPALVETEEPEADVEQCVTLYVKQHFGYDNSEADRFGASYRMAVCDLMNSQANSAAYEEPVEEEEPTPSGDPSTVPPTGTSTGEQAQEPGQEPSNDPSGDPSSDPSSDPSTDPSGDPQAGE